MDNVVLFPKQKKNTPPQTLEEMSLRTADIQRSYSNDFANFLYPILFNEIVKDGIDLDADDGKLYPSVLLVMESILSLLHHARDIHHPLQDFAIEEFKEQDLASLETEIDQSDYDEYDPN